MNSLQDYANAYKRLCKDVDALRAEVRATAEAHERAVANAKAAEGACAHAGKMVMLVAEHGLPEDWTRDWSKE